MMTRKDGALIIALAVQEYLYHVLAEARLLRIPLSAHIDRHYKGKLVQPHFIEVDACFTFTSGMDAVVRLEANSLIQDIFYMGSRCRPLLCTREFRGRKASDLRVLHSRPFARKVVQS